MPTDWTSQPVVTGLTALIYDDNDRAVGWRNRAFEQIDSENPGDWYYHRGTPDWVDIVHTDPASSGLSIDVSNNAFFTNLAAVWTSRSGWRGEFDSAAASMSRLAIPIDYPLLNNLPSIYPPDYNWEVDEIEFEFPPGSGQAAVHGDPTTQLYEVAGVHNMSIHVEGWQFNVWSPIQGMLHPVTASLEILSPHSTTVPASGTAPRGTTWWIADQQDDEVSWAKSTDLASMTLLKSVSIDSPGDPVFDPDSGFWLNPNTNELFTTDLVIPDSMIPRRYADGYAGQYLEWVLAIDLHRLETAPGPGDISQSPTWPHGEGNQEYDFNEYWSANVGWAPSGTIPDDPDNFHYSVRSLYTVTFDWTPPRYRYLNRTGTGGWTVGALAIA